MQWAVVQQCIYERHDHMGTYLDCWNIGEVISKTYTFQCEPSFSCLRCMLSVCQSCKKVYPGCQRLSSIDTCSVKQHVSWRQNNLTARRLEVTRLVDLYYEITNVRIEKDTQFNNSVAFLALGLWISGNTNIINSGMQHSCDLSAIYIGELNVLMLIAPSFRPHAAHSARVPWCVVAPASTCLLMQSLSSPWIWQLLCSPAPESNPLNTRF